MTRKKEGPIGHNRPPFIPRLPGHSIHMGDVPEAIIELDEGTAMGAAPRRARGYVLRFARTRAPWRDRFTGWISSDDPLAFVELRFPDLQAAIDFAERQGWRYRIG